MLGVKHILKVFLSLSLALLVVTGSGGILLNVHTCLSHHDRYIHLFQATGHCETCCMNHQMHVCCLLENSSQQEQTSDMKYLPLCCHDEVVSLSVGFFLNEKQNDAVYEHIIYVLNAQVLDLGESDVCQTSLNFKEVCCVTNPPVKDRIAALGVFLI
ncbi:MAG: hypothetical protein PWR20_1187 [Bacteroidales bacterium]|jgi:hypothetical protein|nr:hypothetical protein [Bacteroidales bacterium]MDN5329413.1 hypothetical protein [Bacteroidales bacterium]